MLDPQVQTLLDKAEQSDIPAYETLAPELARQFYEKGCEIARGDPPEPFKVNEISIPASAGDIKAICYRSSELERLPILVFFHGGGYTIGSPRSHDAVCRHLCVETDCLVVSVDYRLAPEHKFPAATDDAYDATRWVAHHGRELGGDVTRLAVAGDSAGGNLAAVTCLRARATGFPEIGYQLLIYPGTDMTASLPSHRNFSEGYLLTASLINWFHCNYLPDHIDRKDWRVSPLHAESHRDLPPAHVITAGYDPLQDEGKAYAGKLLAAGVPVSYAHYEGMVHGFITQPGFINKSREALGECADKLRSAFQKT